MDPERALQCAAETLSPLLKEFTGGVKRLGREGLSAVETGMSAHQHEWYHARRVSCDTGSVVESACGIHPSSLALA